jgi:hypothetical protein
VLRRGCAHGFDISGAFNERLTHCIHARLNGELKTGAIVFGKGADPEIDPGQVQSFA